MMDNVQVVIMLKLRLIKINSFLTWATALDGIIRPNNVLELNGPDKSLTAEQYRHCDPNVSTANFLLSCNK